MNKKKQKNNKLCEIRRNYTKVNKIDVNLNFPTINTLTVDFDINEGLKQCFESFIKTFQWRFPAGRFELF